MFPHVAKRGKTVDKMLLCECFVLTIYVISDTVNKKSERSCMQPLSCPVNECNLPKQHNLIWLRVLYLILCWCVMAFDPKQAGAFTIMMFILPTLFDLIALPKTIPVVRAIVMVMCFVNAIVLLVIMLSFAGIVSDELSYFVISAHSLVLAGTSISKAVLLGILFIDIFVPLISGIGSPTKSCILLNAACKHIKVE